jgi:glycine/serine hydroxymethyltransferase
MAGNKIEKVCDLCHITLNKNAVYGDSSALAPGGVRIGKLSISLSLSVDLAGLDKL